jgi:hypothetical protein
MQRYTLGDYQSVYRDPGSVEINSQLRQQFAQNFAADDMLAGAVDQMQAADFAGDQEAKKRLESQTREALESRAALGNYESVGMDITKSARQFEKGYKPIAQNYANVQAYKKKLKEDYDAGKIEANTYAAMMPLSTKGYSGIQYLPDGTVDEGSYFAGSSYVDDVDISADFDEVMKSYVAEKYNKTRGGYQTRKTPQGEIEYYVETEYGVEVVDKDKVSELFYDMVQGPKYQAALSQQARVNTYMMDDEDIQQRILTALDGDQEDPESTGLRGQLKEAVALGDKGEAKATALQKQIDAMETALSGTGEETPEEMEKIRRSFIENNYRQAEIAREESAALTKFVREDVIKDSYKMRYSETWLQDRQAKQDALLPALTRNTSALAKGNPGGDNLEDIQGSIDASTTQMQDLVTGFNNQKEVKAYLEENGLPPLTVDNFLNNNIPDALKAIGSDDVVTLRKMQQSMQLQEAFIEEAKEAVGYDRDKVEGGLLQQKYTKGFTSNIKGEEILSFAKEYYKDPDMTMTEVVQLMRTEQAELTKGPLGKNLFGDENVLVHPSKLDKANKFATAFLDKLKGKDRSFARATSEGLVAGILTNSRKVDNKAVKSLNEYIKNNQGSIVNKQIQKTPPTLQGDNSPLAKGIKKQMEEAFMGVGKLPSDASYGYEGKAPDGTSNLTDMRNTFAESARNNKSVDSKQRNAQAAAWEEGKLEVVDIWYDRSPSLDKGGVTFVVRNELGDSKDVFYSRKNFGGSYDDFFNSVSSRAQIAFNEAENVGLSYYEFPLGGGAKMGVTFKESGPDDVTWFTPDPENPGQFLKTMMPSNSPDFEAQLKLADSKGMLNF